MVGENMEKVKKKEEKIFNKVLYLFIVVVGFSFAFVLLINKQQDNNYGDVRNNYFNERTIMGKQIVARDKNSIYPRYYMALFMGNEYVVHVINYYETESQYNLDFSRDTFTILDYDRSKKMIRNAVTKGKGIFTDVLNELDNIIGVDGLEII